MNKTLNLGLSLSIILIFTGCTGSNITLNPNNKVITFVDGKPYAIPKYTVAGKRLMNKKQLEDAKLIGAYCKKGDISWITMHTSYLFDRYGVQGAAEVIKKERLSGCSSPLSDQEYQYRLNQQNQQIQLEEQRKIQQNNNMNEIVNSINNVSKNNIEMMKAMNQPSVIYVY